MAEPDKDYRLICLYQAGYYQKLDWQKEFLDMTKVNGTWDGSCKVIANKPSSNMTYENKER